MIALFFDTETTGIKTFANPDFKPALVQFGAILQDLDSGRVLAEINLMAEQRGGLEIPKEASAIHGITTDMAMAYGVDPSLVDTIISYLADMADILVAHNIDYDLDVIHDNMKLTDLAMVDKPKFCTMDNNVYVVKAPLTDKQKEYFTSKGKKPDAPFKIPNLTETHMHYFEKPFDGAHDAMADIRACRDIFLQMISTGYIMLADDAVLKTDKLTELITQGSAA